MYVSTHSHTHDYTNTEREREREKKKQKPEKKIYLRHVEGAAWCKKCTNKTNCKMYI